MPNSLTILVIAPDRPLRHMLCEWLSEQNAFLLAGIADGENEGRWLAHERHPEGIVLDVDLLIPPTPDVRRQTASLTDRYPRSAVLVIGRYGQEERMLEALRLGAAGCLLESEAGEDSLVSALRTVCHGGAVLPPHLAGLILDELRAEHAGYPPSYEE